MMPEENSSKQDLVLLVADKQMEFAVRGLLERHHALRIRPVSHTIYVHLNRDPGCFNEADSFLRPFHDSFRYAMVLFDYQGSGQTNRPIEEIQDEVEERLRRTGWGERACCIVLDPELEVWVWSDSPEVDRCLRWISRENRVREWLETRGMWEPDQSKPEQPKAALELALRKVEMPRSASLFQDLAERVSVNRCTDGAFARFRSTLQMWFPSTYAEYL